MKNLILWLILSLKKKTLITVEEIKNVIYKINLDQNEEDAEENEDGQKNVRCAQQ